VLGADPNERLVEPVPAVLLEVDGGWVLLDTGLNPALVRDRCSIGASMVAGGGDPARPSRRPVDRAVEEVGLALESVTLVALSHLHNDHAGGVRHFAGTDVPVHVQRRELDYGLFGAHPEPERNAIFRIDFDEPADHVGAGRRRHRDRPGVTAVLTAGHTPGHQSSSSTSKAAAASCSPSTPPTCRRTSTTRSRWASRSHATEANLEPLLRLKAIAAEKGYQLVPGHDPVVWPAFTEQMRSAVFTS